MVGPFCMDAWLLHRGNWSSFVKMRQDFKIAICWKDVGNPNLLKEWSLNPSKYEILCAITFASVTWPPCCCTSLQTHISWLDRPCHLCKSRSRRDLNQLESSCFLLTLDSFDKFKLILFDYWDTQHKRRTSQRSIHYQKYSQGHILSGYHSQNMTWLHVAFTKWL